MLTHHTTLGVTLDGIRDYDILIGDGLLEGAQKEIEARLGKRNYITLCDENAVTHLPAFLKDKLRVLRAGEETKSFSALEDTLDWILSCGIDRHTVVVAFGGGVAGDHAGFAAAVALRGLDYVQVPTTLLAQVDSSVGGKTGINAKQGKNLVGSFHQPRLVLIDTKSLSTLPDREMRAGYAECVKYAFIGDAKFFDWLNDNGAKVLARDTKALEYAIQTSCAAKATIVGADEREASTRALLNFGHTFAHVLEAACGYDRRVLHGEAVAIGMALAFDTSARMGLCPKLESDAAITHMKTMDLPTRIADIKDFPKKSAADLIALMAHDKKVVNGKLTFILSRGMGKAFVTREADMNAVTAALEASF